ncbi:MAG: hypothetical protein AAFW76_05220 [Pseudomonadota bacterium]
MTTIIANGYTALKTFKKPGRNMFWAWVVYQTVKGTLTTSLIWIPLIWAWLR